MELTEAILQFIEMFGLPGAILLALAMAAKTLWNFFTHTYWPSYEKKLQSESEYRQKQMEREADQWTWIVQELANMASQLQRIVDRMDRLEDACREKQLKDIYETQPIPHEEIKRALEESNN